MVGDMKKKNRLSFTMIELVEVVAIISIIFIVGSPIINMLNQNIMLSKTRLSLQQDARNTMSIITRFLREAKSSTILITRYNSSQPFYSMISFSTIDGRNYSFYQDGRKLIMKSGNNITIMSSDLRYLAFAFPDSSNLSIISISLTLERDLFSGSKKALHMASEKVMVMND